MADRRTLEEIEQDLAQARERLAENLSQLVYEVHPKALLHRSVEEGKREFHQAVLDGKKMIRTSCTQMMKLFKDDTGWKPRAVVIGVATTAVVLIALRAATKKK